MMPDRGGHAMKVGSDINLEKIIGVSKRYKIEDSVLYDIYLDGGFTLTMDEDFYNRDILISKLDLETWRDR